MKNLMMLCMMMVVLCRIGIGQEAAVVSLDTQDQAKASQLYQQMKDAEKAWSMLQSEIESRYLTVAKSDPDASGNEYPGDPVFTVSWCSGDCGVTKEASRKVKYYRIGFGSGFEFSKDFRFLVPKLYQPPAVCGWNAVQPTLYGVN